MNCVGLSLGSNKGNRFYYIINGILELKKILKNLKYSGIYLTKPWGIEKQREYLNIFVTGYTDLSPFSLLEKIMEIEKKYGREREYRFSPRTIDIDIIFYEDLILNDEKLKIPHPLMHERGFVLIPMKEILGEWVHPVLKIKLSEIIINNYQKEVKKVIQKEALKI
ncbi:MAG: 2-amino-4-hydroxy-6-hydroxymethyldihydropteridine diphosphokinase [candidate division WOR-3 bacterium]